MKNSPSEDGELLLCLSDVLLAGDAVVIPFKDGCDAIGHELQIKIEEIHCKQDGKYSACAAECHKRNLN